MSAARDDPAAKVTSDEVNAYTSSAFPATGGQCVAVGPTWAIARHRVAEEQLRPGGFVSGPTQFSLADAALWFAIFGAVGIEPMALTSELSIRYLRPAQGDALFARADLHAIGRRNVVGTVTLWMDDRQDRPVSVAQGTYVRPAG